MSAVNDSPDPMPRAPAAFAFTAPHRAVGAEPWIIVAAVLGAYATAFSGTFQFDDWNVIVRDPRVQSLGAWWRSMPGIRPLLKLSFAANHASGLGVAGFHAVNVALHAANAILALALLRRIEARRAAPGASPGPAPLLAALLFALHPIQTEAVTYLSGRSAALAATFVLGSAVVHVAGRDGSRPALSRALSPLLLAAGLATKELAIALPAALVVLELADVRHPLSLLAALRATARHWLVAAAALAAFAAAPTYRRLVGASLELRGPWANGLAHLHGLAWLAGQVARPDRLDADPILPAVDRLDPTAALTVLALLAAIGAGLALLRRRPELAVALLWTVLWLPATGFWLPRAEPANDRQAYLALLGPAWLVGRALAAAATAGSVPSAVRRGAAAAAAAALLAALAIGTSARSAVYSDEVRFWEAVLATSPGSGRALNNLGFALAARCRQGEAESALRRALTAAPEDFTAAVNLKLLLEGEPLGPDEPRCPPPSR